MEVFDLTNVDITDYPTERQRECIRYILMYVRIDPKEIPKTFQEAQDFIGKYRARSKSNAAAFWSSTRRSRSGFRTYNEDDHEYDELALYLSEGCPF